MPAERTLGWWFVWLKRRRIDADRQWAHKRRGEQPPLLFSQMPPVQGLHGGELAWEETIPSPGFEETLVAMMDAEAELARLPAKTRRVILARAAGYKVYEIAAALGVSGSRVSQLLRRKR